QDARLYLKDLPSAAGRSTAQGSPTVAPESPADLWQQQLNLRLSQLDWHQSRQHCNSLRVAQQLTNTWAGRVERWLARSQQILDEVQSLEGEIVALENPLRLEDAARSRLDRLQALSAEQRSLIEQFEGVPKLLEAETKNLAELRRRDLKRIEGLASGSVSESQVQPLNVALCRLFAEDWAGQCWRQVARYAEVADRLGQASLSPENSPHNIDVRASGQEIALIDLSEIKVTGVFETAELATPFEARAKWSLTQEPTLQQQNRFECKVNFYAASGQVEVRVTRDSRLAALNHIEMWGHAVPQPGILAGAAAPQAEIHLQLDSQPSGLVGTMTIDALAIRRLLDTGAKTGLVEVGVAGLPEEQLVGECLDLQVGGQWSAPQVYLAGDAPHWLQNSSQLAMQRELQAAVVALRSRLELEGESKLAEFRQRVGLAAQSGLALTQAHGQQLLAVQDRLQEHLDQMLGTEFARRHGPVSR
ncbi:MAG: hypothetical protein KDA45_08905, partial [Planctomycetales bacterium]|nr:hypothetical protein [Planctomycetales bacterium]